MISKIVKLLGIGTLHEPLQNGALQLREKTIIFGENGRGKSTFVAVLRSLQHGTGEHLRGRGTIGGKHALIAELLSSNQKHSLQNGQWDAAHENIAIFDEVFVSENVYTGAAVNADQRKNLLHFSLGTSGVKLAQKIDDLAITLRAELADEKEAAREIQKYIVGNMSVETFAELPMPAEDIEAELFTARLALTSQTQASTLRDLQSFSPFSFDGIDPSELEFATNSSIDSVSREATARLREHQEQRGVTEEWLLEGFKHCEDGKCPLCAQALNESRMISTYEVCFSDAYRTHRTKVIESFLSIESRISSHVEDSIKRIADLNISRVQSWKQFIPQMELQFEIASAKSCLSNARGALENMRQKRTNDPIAAVVLTDEDEQAFEAVSKLMVIIDDYNAKVVNLNAAIESTKKSAETPNVLAAQVKVDRILSQTQRQRGGAEAAVNIWREKKSARELHERQKTEARGALDKYSAQIPSSLVKSINVHLKGCGTYFQLASMKQVYTGATPRFDYVIEMRGRAVDLTGKPSDGLAFGTALSHGDKSALAFAFFLARLEIDPGLKDQVVVFDDPLSSLDSCRRRYTRKQLADLAPKVSQLIVLTHEEATVAEIADLLFESECCLLHFKEQADFTIIEPISVKDLTASEYVKCYDRLQHFLFNSNNPEGTVKDIRPYLEMNLRYRFPEHFKPEPLGKMIARIRDANGLSDLVRMQGHLQALNEINDYCTSHSHGDGALENVEKILTSDLKTIVKSALEFARGFPQGLETN